MANDPKLGDMATWNGSDWVQMPDPERWDRGQVLELRERQSPALTLLEWDPSADTGLGETQIIRFEQYMFRDRYTRRPRKLWVRRT